MDQLYDAHAGRTALDNLAEAMLNAAGPAFRSYFERSPLPMFLVDPATTRIARANRKALASFGYMREELTGKSIAELTYPGDVVVTAGDYARLQGGHDEDIVFAKRYLRKDGSWFWAQTALNALRDENGDIGLFIGTAVDITGHRQAQEEIRAAVAFYRMAGRAARVGGWALDLPSRQVVWSDEVCTLLEVPLGTRPSLDQTMSHFAPASRPRADEILAKILTNGEPFDEEFKIITASGKQMAARIVGEAMRDDTGNIFRVQGSFQDITPIREADAALRESSERMALFLEYAPAALAMFDTGMRYLAASKRWLRDYLPDAGDVVGKSHYEMFPDITEQWREAHRRGLAGEVVRADEDLFVRADGTKQWVRWEIRPWHKASGEVGGIVIFAEDVTELRQAREKIAKHLSELEEAMHGTLLAVSNMVEQRDPYTAGHERRVGLIAAAIAREMGWPQKEADDLEMIGLVHDIGKIAVPVEILTKPGRLTPTEYELVKQHAARGYEILKNVPFPIPIAEITYQHHERMDGSGYPRGLKGDEILPAARIIAVADVLESMAAHRPYRPALGVEAALGELTSHRGSLYDAGVVDAIITLMREKGYQLPA